MAVGRECTSGKFLVGIVPPTVLRSELIKTRNCVPSMNCTKTKRGFLSLIAGCEVLIESVLLLLGHGHVLYRGGGKQVSIPPILRGPGLRWLRVQVEMC